MNRPNASIDHMPQALHHDMHTGWLTAAWEHQSSQSTTHMETLTETGNQSILLAYTQWQYSVNVTLLMVIIPVEACTAETAAAQVGEGVLWWGVPHSLDFHPEPGMMGSCPGLTVGVGGCRMGRWWVGRGSVEGAEKRPKTRWGLGGSAVQLEGSTGDPEGAAAAAVAGGKLEEATEEAVLALMSKPAVAAAAVAAAAVAVAVLALQREHMETVVECTPAKCIVQSLRVSKLFQPDDMQPAGPFLGPLDGACPLSSGSTWQNRLLLVVKVAIAYLTSRQQSTNLQKKSRG